MFLRKMKRRKDSKLHYYWALVESVRTAQGPRQRVVAHLGELGGARRQGFGRLVAELEGRDESQQLMLFDSQPAAEWVTVDVRRVRTERVRDLGQVWLILQAWHQLGLEGFFQRHLPVGKEAIGWADRVAYRVVAQVCAPSSELAVAERFVDRTALEDLLGIDAGRIDDNRLLRTLDRAVGLGPPWASI